MEVEEGVPAHRTCTGWRGGEGRRRGGRPYTATDSSPKEGEQGWRWVEGELVVLVEEEVVLVQKRQWLAQRPQPLKVSIDRWH